jgi:hypothetical protein
MNFFLPGFFNQIQNLPASFLHQIEHDETVSFSTMIVTLLLTMTTVEAVILILFTLYSWCRLCLDPTDFLWFEEYEDEEEEEDSKCWVERSRRIQEELEEKRYELLGPDRPSCCPICLNNYESNDLVAGSSKCCRHIFHKSCLVRWLQNQSSCPYCRQDLLKSSEEKTQPSEPTTTTTTLSSNTTHYIASWPEATPEYHFEIPDFCFFLF